MGLLSFLKAPEMMGKAMDAVIKGGDALVYTEEEKAEMRMKMAEIQMKHIELTNQENTATSIARRWLAMVIAVPFVFLTVGSAIFYAFGAFLGERVLGDKGQSTYDHWAIAVSEHWQELAMEDFATLTMMVAVFYFGNHMVKSLRK